MGFIKQHDDKHIFKLFLATKGRYKNISWDMWFESFEGDAWKVFSNNFNENMEDMHTEMRDIIKRGPHKVKVNFTQWNGCIKGIPSCLEVVSRGLIKRYIHKALRESGIYYDEKRDIFRIKGE